MQTAAMGHQRPSNTDEVWWDFWEVCSIKLLIPPVCELPWPASVISFSLVGGDMLHGKGNHHGLVWNQILLSQLLTSLLYDRMWKLTWISAWGQCLPLSREYGVSLFFKTSLFSHYWAWMCVGAQLHTRKMKIFHYYTILESKFLNCCRSHSLSVDFCVFIWPGCSVNAFCTKASALFCHLKVLWVCTSI